MSDRCWHILSCILLLAVGGIMAATTRDYGITWDEEYQQMYGDAVLNWYSSFFSDRTALDLWNLYYYGGFFDLIAQLAARHSPIGLYETRHVLNVAFGLMSIVATYGIGVLLAGRAGGFFSALFLILTPVYYGHVFNNPKDIPFAALFTVSTYFILLSLKSLPLLPRRRILQLGVAIGLAMGVRIAGAVLLAYLALAWGAWVLGRNWGGAALDPGKLFRLGRRLGLRFLLVWGVAWVVMLAFWPWAQVSPLLHPWEGLMTMASFGWPLKVFFEGRQVLASELPPSYLPTWFAISLPEFYLLALPAGCVLALKGLRKPSRVLGQLDLALGVALLIIVVCFPILVVAVLHSTVYDGLRQFLFVIPALSVLAGISVAALLQSKILFGARLLMLGAVLLSAGLTVFDMVELHPYQYVYFNRLVAGGLEAAASRFETDYYGVSYREGVLWLIDNYPPQSGEKVRVANASWRMQTAYYLEKSEELRSRFAPVQPFERPDVYLTTTRWDNHKKMAGEVLHVVIRKGVPLLYIIEVDKTR